MARKIEFDRERALQQSMMLFWEKGYENTSMQDLVTTLEINRFSIYNTFGDKKALFLLALEHYRLTVFEQLNKPLKDQSEESAKVRLDHYLENFANHITSNNGELGCMLQASTLSEVSEEKEVKKVISASFESLQTNLELTLTRAKEQNELKPDCNIQIASFHILCALQGLIVLRKSQKQKEVSGVKAQINFLRQTISAW